MASKIKYVFFIFSLVFILISVIFLCIDNPLIQASSYTLTQTRFKIYQDDAGINSASQFAAENTNYNVNVLSNFRLRMQVVEDSMVDASVSRRLEFKEDSGSWTQITTNSNNVRLSLSSNFADGDATTARLSAGGGDFIAGQGKESGSTTSSVTLNGSYVEDEWCLQFQAGAAGHTYQFRVTNNGTSSFFSYSQTPTISPIGGIFEQKHFQILKDDAGLGLVLGKAGEDTNFPILTSTNFRIRFSTANTGFAAKSITRRLEFKQDSGSWTQITTNSNNVRLSLSSNLSDGDATTAKLTSEGTFTAGQGKESGSDTSSVDLTNGYYIEDEYSIAFQTGAAGHSYQFRISNAGTALDTYTNTPTVRAISSSGLRLEKKLRLNNGDLRLEIK